MRSKKKQYRFARYRERPLDRDATKMNRAKLWGTHGAKGGGPCRIPQWEEQTGFCIWCNDASASFYPARVFGKKFSCNPCYRYFSNSLSLETVTSGFHSSWKRVVAVAGWKLRVCFSLFLSFHHFFFSRTTQVHLYLSFFLRLCDFQLSSAAMISWFLWN